MDKCETVAPSKVHTRRSGPEKTIVSRTKVFQGDNHLVLVKILL